MPVPHPPTQDDIRLFGRIRVCVRDWSPPLRGRGRMFEHEWLERLSCVNPLSVPLVFGPAVVWLASNGLMGGISPIVFTAVAAAGFIGWTLLEYVVHRFLFHFQPRGQNGQAIAFLMHGVHHAFPDDDRRWVIPLTVSIPTALGLFAVSRAALGELHDAVFAGFLAGYLSYDVLHYLTHRGPMTSRWGRFLRAYHLAHHHASPDRHFGISSPLWDHVFRTVDDRPPKP